MNDLSDHLPIFTLVHDLPHLKHLNNDCVIIRDFSKKNLNYFHNSLTDCDWTFLSKYSDPTLAYDSFISKYSHCYNKGFPKKVLKGKKLKSFHNPWLTNGC